MMPIYKVDLYSGYCRLMEARSLRSARSLAARENGTNNLKWVELATPQDIAHIRRMGGYVPESAPIAKTDRRLESSRRKVVSCRDCGKTLTPKQRETGIHWCNPHRGR